MIKYSPTFRMRASSRNAIESALRDPKVYLVVSDCGLLAIRKESYEDTSAFRVVNVFDFIKYVEESSNCSLPVLFERRSADRLLAEIAVRVFLCRIELPKSGWEETPLRPGWDGVSVKVVGGKK